MFCGLDNAPWAAMDDAGPASAGPVSPSAGGGHAPVLPVETLALLRQHQVAGAPHFLDCTFGGGGHARALLEGDPAARLTALDRDPAAAERARVFAAEFGVRFQFHNWPFSRLHELADDGFAGILLDLGVSSFQLDEPARGFSFRHAGPADMRLDPREGVPAAQFLEEASPAELTAAVRDAGEERQWRRVVAAIVAARGTGRLARTDTLAALVADAVGGPPARLHPATRTFMGLRITLNQELVELESALPRAAAKLAPGGVLAAISFHALEDRLVKRFCNRLAGRPESENDATPAQLRHARAERLTRRPVTPSEEETAINPRARSAKLRAVRILRSPSGTPRAPTFSNHSTHSSHA